MSELHFLTTPATRLIDACKCGVDSYDRAPFESFFWKINEYISNPDLFTEGAYKRLTKYHIRYWDRAYKKAKYAIEELSTIPDLTMDDFLDQLDEDGKYVPIIRRDGHIVRLIQIKGENPKEYGLEIAAGWK